jgi:hypothetical protein
VTINELGLLVTLFLPVMLISVLFLWTMAAGG